MRHQNLPIGVELADGDYDRQYAKVTIGPMTVTVYQSEVRGGGVTLEIDTQVQPVDLAIYYNDDQIF